MQNIDTNAVRGHSYENFFARKFIIRKFLYTKISRSKVKGQEQIVHLCTAGRIGEHYIKFDETVLALVGGGGG